MTAEEFFGDLLGHIQVTEDEIAEARLKRDELATTTKKIVGEFGITGVGSFAAGALAAGTQIKPLNDVDLVVYGTGNSLPTGWQENPGTALAAICSRLGSETGYVCKPRAHAVKVEFPDVAFSADVVFGVSRSPEGLLIPHCPSGVPHKWIDTHPRRHAELIRSRNAETTYKFARVVRILKALNTYWGAQSDTGKKPLSSFHLTSLAWTIATEIVSLGSGVEEVLRRSTDLVLRPLPDPSGVGDPIEARDPEFATRKLGAAAAAVADAIAAGDEAEKILVTVFGDQAVIEGIIGNKPMSVSASGKLKLGGTAAAGSIALPRTTSYGDHE